MGPHRYCPPVPTHLFALRETMRAQSAETERLLAEHLAAGDDLARSRLVTHLASFRVEASCRLFQSSLEGFAFSALTSERDLSWRLVFSRSDPLTPAHIHRLTQELISATQIYGGRYEGWSALSAGGTGD